MPKLALPNEINLLHPLGEGRRSCVYLADMAHQRVVIKVYKSEYIAKYQSQYKVNIGEFEFFRNRTAYQAERLKQYVAKPYQLLLPSQGYDLALVQEYIDGVWLEDLMQELHGLPEQVLQAGYEIVREAAKVDLYDLDIPPGNIRLIKDQQGNYIPKLYDFNLMPQHMCPPNPFMALGFKLGLRNKNHRDFRSLKHWAFLGRQAALMSEQKD